MKTYHDIKLKSGIRLVLARSKFHTMFGHQVVNKGDKWDTVRITASKDGQAVSTIISRSSMKTNVRNEIKVIKNKLVNL